MAKSKTRSWNECSFNDDALEYRDASLGANALPTTRSGGRRLRSDDK